MKISNILSSVAILFLVTACTTKTVEINNPILKTEEAVNNSIETIKNNTQVAIKEKILEIKMNSNELEFLEILKNDNYASLCGSKDEYLNLLTLANGEEKSEKLAELFYTYTNNLSNSCIDQKSFKKELKKRKYKDANQDYEVYNVDINKKELLEKFSSNTQTVKSILETYTPKHPQFFALIKKLDDSSLSQSKINKLRLNIERLKLLKYSNSNNFIQLNVPSYNFAFYEGGKRTKTFGTVVGAPDAQTPVLSSKLAYFIVNPTWNIPDSIAKSSIIPKALKDKNYLKKKNIVIRKNYRLDSKKINFKDVNWKKYLKKNVRYIPYKFIQLPSRTNGMGRMKFIFPNDYAVYMHDTIGTWRFKSSKQKIRFVSHGCIRLEHPVSLMKYLSQNYTKYSYKKVRGIYDSQRTDTIRLNKKLPIHLTYQTVQINNGKLSFYSDIYGYDKIQKLNF
ncbi:MAG: L,D-transpeptidase family protein [Poseidonibacter sp.]